MRTAELGDSSGRHPQWRLEHMICVVDEYDYLRDGAQVGNFRQPLR